MELPHQLLLFSGMGPGAENEGLGEWVWDLCLPLDARVTLLLMRTSAQDTFLIRAGMAQPAKRGWGGRRKDEQGDFCLPCE